MRLIKASLVALLFLAASAAAQNCDSLINDEVGAIKNPAAVEKAAANLINQGATVHVIVAARGADLKAVETDYENHCPTWRSGSGRKAGLFTLLVAPNQRKKAIFFGSSFKAAFPTDASIDQPFSKSSNSFFAKGDWEGGISAGLSTFGSRLAAYNNPPAAPAPTYSQSAPSAPTDLTPVASVFKWLIGLLFLAGLAFGLWFLFSKKKEGDESTELAQQTAINSMQEATNGFLALDKSAYNYAAVAETYNTLVGSISADPNEKGLSAATYKAIGDKWERLNASVSRASFKASSFVASEPPATKAATAQSHRPASRNSSIHVPTPPAPTPQPVHTHTQQQGHTHRVVERETYIPVPVPIVIDEPRRSRSYEEEDRPSRSYEAPSRSSRDDDDGGSSSSFPSSSSSSRDDDSGSVSSFTNDSSSSSDSSSSGSDGGSSSDF
jgi:uncharacterized membrane protein YgcG